MFFCVCVFVCVAWLDGRLLAPLIALSNREVRRIKVVRSRMEISLAPVFFFRAWLISKPTYH